MSQKDTEDGDILARVVKRSNVFLASKPSTIIGYQIVHLKVQIELLDWATNKMPPWASNGRA